MTHRKHIAVIGAGPGGLAAAIRLAVAGHTVELFEANPYPGGKLAEVSQQGYRFDAGPSLFTMPQLVDELFAAAGENPREHFRYQRLETITHYFWEDGTRLRAWAEAEKFAAEAAEVFGQEAAPQVQAALQHSQQLYDTLAPLFMERSLHRASTWTNAQAWKAYTRLPQLSLTGTLHGANSKRFAHPKLVQLFNRYATYNGSDPYQTPSTMQIIPHLEFGLGAYFPEGGMVAIPRSLAALAERQGVKLHLNSPVDRIVVKGKKVSGVVVNGEERAFDGVVSNMDMVPTYRRLLPDQKAPEKLLKQDKSSSALIFYWGVKQEFEQLGLHNIFFTEDYRTEFGQLFHEKTLGEDPTVYVNISSKCQREDAPAGCENWFVMVNAPHEAGQDWERLIGHSRQAIIKKLSRMLGTDLAPLIETEDILHPQLIEKRTSSHLGALYGNASNSPMAAFLRHPNWSSRLSGLYFCGGSVHPGGGIPLALLSGRLAAEAVAQRG